MFSGITPLMHSAVHMLSGITSSKYSTVEVFSSGHSTDSVLLSNEGSYHKKRAVHMSWAMLRRVRTTFHAGLHALFVELFLSRKFGYSPLSVRKYLNIVAVFPTFFLDGGRGWTFYYCYKLV